ncbi:MAG TPA: PAS domain S-box protein [Blastocatellia bacterium]
MKFRYLSYTLLFLAVGATYFGAAELGLSQAFLHANVSPVWPPTGVAIAAVLWLGYRISPAVFAGAFLANLATEVSVATAGGIALGNTLEAVCAAFLLQRLVGSRFPFYRGKDVVKFVVIAGALSTMVSATIGNVSLCLGGASSWANFGKLWLTWWLGDGVGALVIAPLLLTWIDARSERWSISRWIEAGLLLISLSIVAWIIYGGLLFPRGVYYPVGHLAIPFLLWAAFRLGPRGATTAIAVLSAVAIWGTRQGFGPFAGHSSNESLLLLQVFVGAISITALVVAAIVIERRRAEEIGSLLSSIVESTDDAVIGRTLDGTIVSWNASAERVYGYTPQEAIGRHLSMLVPPERANELPQMLERLAQGGHVDRFETERVRKDGRVIHVALTVSPIKDSSGKIVGGSVIARDVTQRKEAEEALRESQARLAGMIDLAMDAIITVDEDQRIIIFNAAAERMFGCAADRAIGQSISTFIPDRFRDAHRLHVNAFGQTGVTRRSMARLGDIFGLRADGVEFPIEASISQVSTNGQRLYTVILRDITERKRAEDERESLLAREQQSRAEAEDANRLKDEFLATVSHELRTPLTSMLGWAQLLRGRLTEASAQRGLETIERNAKAQVQLIEDLLDVSRIITGKLRLNVRPVQLADIVIAVLDLLRPAANAKGVKLESVLDRNASLVSGDPDRLQQIVWNLVSNAIKFTPKSGSVEVRLERKESDAQLTVTDTGVGIGTEFLPYVFDRFRQADSSRTRRHGGLGLGLSIVRQLVELHGGAVTAFSAGEGRGASFTIMLPVVEIGAERGAGDAENRVVHAAALDGVSVLVVDDDNDTRALLDTMLRHFGADVIAVDSAVAALQVLAEAARTPDVLLSDIGMPGEDGYDLIRKVRQMSQERGFRLPAIALTGYARVEERARALEEGYQRYLPKPVETTTLVTMISEVTARTVSGADY